MREIDDGLAPEQSLHRSGFCDDGIFVKLHSALFQYPGLDIGAQFYRQTRRRRWRRRNRSLTLRRADRKRWTRLNGNCSAAIRSGGGRGLRW